MQLTPKKRAILQFIKRYQEENDGGSPSLEEIAEHLGISSVSTVHVHLKDLERMGQIAHSWNAKRELKILQASTKTSLNLLGYIAAGKPIESVPDPQSFDIHEMLLGDGANFLLRIVGDSMVDEGVRDGDFVVVRKREEAEEGEMVVALYEGEVTLKRFYPRGKMVHLKPSNTTMEPIIVPAGDVKIQGVVVGLLRKY